MAEKNKERKIILEREYVVPMRREFLKVPGYRKAEKAVKALKEFMVQHMKVYDRDLRKIKMDVYLNNEIRFRGMKKPLAKVKVKAIKYDDGIVEVKLVQLPKHIEFEIARKARQEAEKQMQEKPVQAKKEDAKEDNAEKKEDAKEKETSSKEATEKMEKAEAKEMKHTSKIAGNTPKIQRKALRK